MHWRASHNTKTRRGFLFPQKNLLTFNVLFKTNFNNCIELAIACKTGIKSKSIQVGTPTCFNQVVAKHASNYWFWVREKMPFEWIPWILWLRNYRWHYGLITALATRSSQWMKLNFPNFEMLQLFIGILCIKMKSPMTGYVHRYCEHLLILPLKTWKNHVLRKRNEILMHGLGR